MVYNRFSLRMVLMRPMLRIYYFCGHDSFDEIESLSLYKCRAFMKYS